MPFRTCVAREEKPMPRVKGQADFLVRGSAAGRLAHTEVAGAGTSVHEFGEILFRP